MIKVFDVFDVEFGADYTEWKCLFDVWAHLEGRGFEILKITDDSILAWDRKEKEPIYFKSIPSNKETK